MCFFLLIEITATLFMKAEAANFFLFIWKFIIIGDLLVLHNWHFGVDDNLLATIGPIDYFRITIWHAAVIDKTSFKK